MHNPVQRLRKHLHQQCKQRCPGFYVSVVGIGQGHFIELGHVLRDGTAVEVHHNLSFLQVHLHPLPNVAIESIFVVVIDDLVGVHSAMVESLHQGVWHAWPQYLQRAWHRCRPFWRETRHTSTENSGIIVPVSRMGCTEEVIIVAYLGSRGAACPLSLLRAAGDHMASATAA
jgi:hypothetical protein